MPCASKQLHMTAYLVLLDAWDMVDVSAPCQASQAGFSLVALPSDPAVKPFSKTDTQTSLGKTIPKIQESLKKLLQDQTRPWHHGAKAALAALQGSEGAADDA